MCVCILWFKFLQSCSNGVYSGGEFCVMICACLLSSCIAFDTLLLLTGRHNAYARYVYSFLGSITTPRLTYQYTYAAPRSSSPCRLGFLPLHLPPHCHLPSASTLSTSATPI